MKLIRLWIVLFIITNLFACKKDDSASNGIYGIWFKDNEWGNDPTDLTYHEVYEFSLDGKLVIKGSIIDKSKNKIYGYLSMQTGTFSLNSDSLIFENMKFYSSGVAEYKPLNELQYVNTYSRMPYKPVFSQDELMLTLQFNCPPLANCGPHPKLTRVK
jgi:hypothetical protein